MAARKTGGLGRGLDTIIPVKKSTEKTSDTSENKKKAVESRKGQNTISKSSENEGIKQEKKKSSDTDSDKTRPERLVKISSVEPNRSQPRKRFDEDALNELAESIKQYGVLQPLLVSDKKDYYEIIAGERRWRAAKIAGCKEIPVIVKEFSDQEIVEISLIENIQREDLNPIEEAKAYKRLLDEFSLTQEQIADRVSKSRTAVTNSMRLLKLDEKVQEMLVEDMISAGHARAILSIPSGELQQNAAMKVFDEKLSVRDTEKLVKRMLDPTAPKQPKIKDTETEAILENLEERMKNILGTKVIIQRKRNNKGKIEIEYYSKEELERIFDLFESIG